MLDIFNSFLPEVFLSLAILFLLCLNARFVNSLDSNFPIISNEIFSQISFILLNLLIIILNLQVEGFFSTLIFVNNLGSGTIKAITVLTSLAVLITLIRSFNIQKLNFFEYFLIFLLSLFALFLLVNAVDMLSTYLVIEMQALAFYILACFRRNSAFSTEAGLKYFISGSYISGIFLLGCSIIYVTFGTLAFSDLNYLLAFPLTGEFESLFVFFLIGTLLITITLLFKLSAVPFHFWSPDVYEGAPLASTIIFSTIPKLALFHFLIKWITLVGEHFSELRTILLILGLLSALVGAFFAIRQKRLKRLVIYSSISQSGFLFAALSSNSLSSVAGIYFFLVIYLITSVLVWNQIASFYTSQSEVLGFFNRLSTSIFISNLANLFINNKFKAFSFIIIFFSIAGIPPLSGFLSKFLIIFGLIESNHIIWSLVLILISAISVFYYLKIIKIVVFESKTLNSQNNFIQVLFNNSFFFFDLLCIVFFLFLLMFLFFEPTALIVSTNGTSEFMFLTCLCVGLKYPLPKASPNYPE